ncbi:MAG TPA: sigma-54 dependent transcriptional regulator, partial [Desulfomonilia bacterium]|nr:sigma-54 dependent transcriptional regulator [Desulfomonilia bacterium]
MEKNLSKILVVDDEEYTRAFFEEILSRQDYNVSFSQNAEDALEKWGKETFDLIIMDIRMPGIDGIEALQQIRSRDTETLIIMISAFGDMDTVIDAMRCGANDFFIKPFSSIDKIKLDINNWIDRRKLMKENERLKYKISSELAGRSMLYVSKEMEYVTDLISRAAHIDLPVLILGESGTGKELVARSVHANSPRKDSLFFSVNCGALTETLLEPALFGYEKGAFTGAASTRIGYFEAAEGGTIFLDEIAETSTAFQVKLLRVLQENEIMRVGGTKPIKVDFRLISATNTDLGALIKAGKFRKDLFYRINVIKIEIPPLRDRKDDIPLLLEQFMKEVCERNNIRKKHFKPDVMTHLMRLPWEGNVREL